MKSRGCCNADLAISRAGAGSLSELAVCGTPTVLVPFPQAADQHQEANAACAASLGAAVIVHQHDPEQPMLLTTVERLLAVKQEGLIQRPIPSPGCVKACRPWRNGMPNGNWPPYLRHCWPRSSQRSALQILTHRPHNATVVATRLQPDP